MSTVLSSPQSSIPISVSVMSYDGTLVSDCRQTSPPRLKTSSSALPSRPKGPLRASSTSSLERIAEMQTSDVLKNAFVKDIGWASQVTCFLFLTIMTSQYVKMANLSSHNAKKSVREHD